MPASIVLCMNETDPSCMFTKKNCDNFSSKNNWILKVKG